MWGQRAHSLQATAEVTPTVDLAPTIFAAAGVAVPTVLEGRSLFGDCRDWACAEMADVTWDASSGR